MSQSVHFEDIFNRRRFYRISRHFIRMKALITFTVSRWRCGTLLLIFIMTVYCTASYRNAFDRVLSKDGMNRLDSYRLPNHNGKVIFIFSNQRSGSTFLGEFFNRNPSLFYLYEPLFPFGFYCDKGVERRMQTLANMSICDFRHVTKAYREASGASHRCLKSNICYPEKSESMTKNYAGFCNKVIGNSELNLQGVHFDARASGKQLSPSSQANCPRLGPYNMTLVSALCAASNAAVYKILRVCDLAFLEDLYNTLQSKNRDVYVIHLVRDPRAIMRSASATEGLQQPEMEWVTEKLCRRLKRNILYVESKEKDKQGMTSLKHYRRIRYEDIAKDPMNMAREIYRFVGLSFPDEVANWLRDSTSDPAATISKYEEQLKSTSSIEERKVLMQKIAMIKRQTGDYGTVRDSKKASSKWRKIVRMEVVNKVQKSCKFAMEKLGYIPVHDVKELRDLEIDLVKDS